MKNRFEAQESGVMENFLAKEQRTGKKEAGASHFPFQKGPTAIVNIGKYGTVE